MKARLPQVRALAGDAVADACVQHFEMVVKWNATHNLTRVTDEDDAEKRHYLDVLVPAIDLHGTRGVVVDIGSGAGFPGLLLPLVWPDVRVVLVEPAKKRASFLALAAGALGLRERVDVRPGPVSREGQVVTSRATFPSGQRGPLAEACAPGGLVLLWSVPDEADPWAEEARANGLEPLPPAAYRVPGLDERAVLRARRL